VIRLVRDGAPRPLPSPGPVALPGRPRRGKPFRVLVLGGARSGKSVTAERLLGRRDQVDYVACGPPADASDPSWAQRVRLHRERRPAHWTTLETLDVAGVLAGRAISPARQAAPMLVDCLSTWLAGVMDDCGLWTGAGGADKEVAARVDALLDAWRSTSRQVVAVSNEVGSGVVPATVSGARFRDDLGMLNARVVAGIARRIR
jgi:adenosylcobinamide kinase/adenosylcobinamide-phosphate guanylyltransferase